MKATHSFAVRVHLFGKSKIEKDETIVAAMVSRWSGRTKVLSWDGSLVQFDNEIASMLVNRVRHSAKES